MVFRRTRGPAVGTWRQRLAYLAVFAAGGASLATSNCDSVLSASVSTIVNLGAPDDATYAHFVVTTDRDLDELDAFVRITAGDGSVHVTVPSPLLAPRAGEMPVPSDTEAVAFDATPAVPGGATVCRGVCAKTFDVELTRAGGTEPVEVELQITAKSVDYGCDPPNDYYIVVQRVDE